MSPETQRFLTAIGASIAIIWTLVQWSGLSAQSSAEQARVAERVNHQASEMSDIKDGLKQISLKMDTVLERTAKMDGRLESLEKKAK